MAFLDIFFTGKVKEEEKTRIIVDWREKNSLVMSELVKLGCNVQFAQLGVGDYIIGDIAVERKTLSDLKNSIIDKRIFSQLTELKQYSNCLLILEQNESIASNMNENALKGFLLSVALKFKVPIIYSNGEKDTAKYSILLANKKEGGENSIRPNKRIMSKEEQLQFILEGFPKVGPVRARKLMTQFKNLKNIANASIEDLESVIGKDARLIYDLFNQEFEL